MQEQSTVPKKKEPHHHSVAACESLKGNYSGKELFRAVYGREGTASEVQTLVNRLNPNRSNPGADIIGELTEKLPHLKSMTLSEFFKIK